MPFKSSPPRALLAPHLRLVLTLILITAFGAAAAPAAPLWAGAAKVDITVPGVPSANEPWFVKALVIGNERTQIVIISVDAVAIGGIGSIRQNYVSNVRTALQAEFNVAPGSVLFNATHRHGSIAPDIEARTLQAVRAAWAARTPASIGAGTGREDRIMQNRRVRLQNGREADLRQAYPTPNDKEVAGVGPVDSEIGVLRVDRTDGTPLAVLFNFAMHPIQSAPHGRNSADVNEFAARVIEENAGHGAIALFIQGCAGDIAPVWYKDVSVVRDPEPLGHRLGLSALRAWRTIVTRSDAKLEVLSEVLALPRADHSRLIPELEAERAKLLQSFKPTSLNFKSYLPLAIRHALSPEFPSADANRYLHEQAIGQPGLPALDADNVKRIRAYQANIHVMEQLIRLQTNLALVQRHHANNQAAGPTVAVEIMALRIGDFRLLTFPGELSVQIGLNLKQASPHELTFVAGYSNGYIHYCPTAEQLRNAGHALEDSQCLLAPEWQARFESKALELLRRL